VFAGSTTAVDEEIKGKKLVNLFPSFEMPNVPVYAVTPNTRHVPEKVRLLIEFLREKLSNEPAFNPRVKKMG
jgi:DNA-binding transcriptional LysR family regulator